MTLTQNSRAEMQAEAKAGFDALKKIATDQLQQENDSDKIKKPEAEVEAWKARAVSAGAAALDGLQSISDASKETVEWKRAHEQLKEQMARMQGQHQEEISISGLKHQLSEIRRFKAVPSETGNNHDESS